MSGIAGMIAAAARSLAPVDPTPIVPTFTNGNFSTATFTYSAPQAVWTTTGWVIGNAGQIRMNGASTIQGWPTPTDPTPKPYKSPGERTGTMTYSFQTMNTGLPASLPYPPNQAIRLYSSGTVNTGYGLVNGPYLASTTAVALKNGDVTKFWWRAANGSDAYNIIAYLLNIATGVCTILIRATGATSSASTAWAQVSRTFNTAAGDVPGNYKFVFISGSYDATGGKALGASLYIANVEVVQV